MLHSFFPVLCDHSTEFQSCWNSFCPMSFVLCDQIVKGGFFQFLISFFVLIFVGKRNQSNLYESTSLIHCCMYHYQSAQCNKNRMSAWQLPKYPNQYSYTRWSYATYTVSTSLQYKYLKTLEYTYMWPTLWKWVTCRPMQY